MSWYYGDYGYNYGRGDYGRGRYGDSGDYGDYGRGANYGANADQGGQPRWTYTAYYWFIPGEQTGNGPQGYQRSDQQLKDDICDRLTQHGHLDARGVKVDVKDGVVTLTGNVDSRQDKRMAEDTADSVSGVKDVNNQLQIQQHQRDQQNQRQNQKQMQDQPQAAKAAAD